MERHHVALLQQRIERHVVGRGFGTTVIGQDAAAEAPQPVDHCCADASCSDDPDGHVAEFFPAHVVQSVVMSLSTADGGFGMSNRHQHQHQRVVGDAVGRIGDVLNGRCPRSRAYCRSIWLYPTLLVEMYLTPAWRSATKGGAGDLRLVADADASIPGCQFNIGFRYRCLCDSWHDAEARRHLSEQGGLVRPASIDGESHLGRRHAASPSAHWWSDTAAEDEDAGDRVRRAAVRAGSAVGHALQSSQRDVASTYAVFDTPTICSGP